jgi:hypothetical protein
MQILVSMANLGAASAAISYKGSRTKAAAYAPPDRTATAPEHPAHGESEKLSFFI